MLPIGPTYFSRNALFAGTLARDELHEESGTGEDWRRDSHDLNKGHDIVTCFPILEGFGAVTSTSHIASYKVPIPDRFSRLHT